MHKLWRSIKRKHRWYYLLKLYIIANLRRYSERDIVEFDCNAHSQGSFFDELTYLFPAAPALRSHFPELICLRAYSYLQSFASSVELLLLVFYNGSIGRSSIWTLYLSFAPRSAACVSFSFRARSTSSYSASASWSSCFKSSITFRWCSITRSDSTKSFCRSKVSCVHH